MHMGVTIYIYPYVYSYVYQCSVDSVLSDPATPWTVACQMPLCLGFSRQKYWSWLSCTPPGDLPNPGIEPGSPALQVDSLLLSHQGSSMYGNIEYIVLFTLFIVILIVL